MGGAKLTNMVTFAFFFPEIVTEANRLPHSLMRKPQTQFLGIDRLMNLLLGSPKTTFRFPASTDERSGSVSMFSIELRKAELKHP